MNSLQVDKKGLEFFSNLLSIHEGRLTADERYEIRQRIKVVNRFLKKATWPLLKKSTELASEGLDGSGELWNH